MMQKNTKRRWDLLRLYIDEVCPKLPNSSHVAVLLYCWARGRTVKHDGQYTPVTQFCEAVGQIAEGTSMSRPRVYQVLKDLEKMGVIATSPHQKPGYATRRRILIPGFPTDGSWPGETPESGVQE